MYAPCRHCGHYGCTRCDEWDSNHVPDWVKREQEEIDQLRREEEEKERESTNRERRARERRDQERRDEGRRDQGRREQTTHESLVNRALTAAPWSEERTISRK